MKNAVLVSLITSKQTSRSAAARHTAVAFTDAFTDDISIIAIELNDGPRPPRDDAEE